MTVQARINKAEKIAGELIAYKPGGDPTWKGQQRDLLRAVYGVTVRTAADIANCEDYISDVAAIMGNFDRINNRRPDLSTATSPEKEREEIYKGTSFKLRSYIKRHRK